MIAEPFAPVGNGRDTGGRFAAGNSFAKGNPYGRRVNELRGALFDAVGPEDLREIVRSLVEQAKEGNIPAAREVLDRTLGKADVVDLLERIDRLEELLGSVADKPSR
jgi:hypothetical protein